MVASLDDVIDDIGCGPGQYLLVFFAGEVMSGLVKTTMSVGLHEYLIAINFSAFERAMVFSAIFIGNAAGNACSGVLGDTFGRRPPIVGGNAIVALGLCLLTGGGPTFLTFATCNVCIGAGIGLMGPVCWTLIGEVSPSKDRPYLSGLGHLSWSIGALIVPITMASGHSSNGLLAIASAIACACTFGAFCFVFESPAYLANKGLSDRADIVLQNLRERNGKGLPSVSPTIPRIWTYVKPAAERSSYLGLLADTRSLMTTLACCIVVMTLNYSNYGMFYLLPDLLPNHENLIFAGTLFLGICSNAFTIVYGHLIPRRRLMIMSISVGAVCAVGLLTNEMFHVLPRWLTLVLVCGQLTFVGIAFFGIYLYVIEVIGTASRASAAGCSMMTGRIAATIAPFVREGGGTGCFIAIMAFAQILSVVLIAMLQVEPNMRQLGEISSETTAISGSMLQHKK